MIGGTQSPQIKFQTHQVSDPQTGEQQQYQRSSPTVVTVLNLMPGFPAWGSNKGSGDPTKGLGIPRESDLEGQQV